MFKVTIRGLEVSCESTQEIVALVLAASTPAKPTPTPPRATEGRTKSTAAQKKARAKKAREGYKKKKAAEQRYLTKKAAEDAVKAPLDLSPPPPTPPALTTAEKHHGAKEKRADTGGDIISALRRSGLPLTIPEIRDDLQKAGWKYNGPDPKGTIRATLNRLVTKGEVAKGSNNGALTFRIARVEHADPLPHQQRESDV